jgi:hypothetical protein
MPSSNGSLAAAVKLKSQNKPYMTTMLFYTQKNHRNENYLLYRISITIISAPYIKWRVPVQKFALLLLLIVVI